jgi:hypothetical protein
VEIFTPFFVPDFALVAEKYVHMPCTAEKLPYFCTTKTQTARRLAKKGD